MNSDEKIVEYAYKVEVYISEVAIYGDFGIRGLQGRFKCEKVGSLWEER